MNAIAARASRWARFTGAVSACFYVMMTLSLAVHEILGHVLAGVACGGTRIAFAIGPGFSGWGTARGDHGQAAATFIQYAGIAANAVVAVAAFGALRFRRPHLSPGGLALFWLAITEAGHAAGYTLQGLLFRQGDARDLPSLLGPVARVGAVAVLAVLFLALAHWALQVLSRFVQEHYGAGDRAALRAAFLSSVTLPLGLIVAVAPGLPGRPLWTRVVFDGAVFAVLVLGSLWCTRQVNRRADPSGARALSSLAAGAWMISALVTFLFTSVWLSEGVRFRLGAG